MLAVRLNSFVIGTVLSMSLAYGCRGQDLTDAQSAPPQNPPAQGGQTPRQEENKAPKEKVRNERWNLVWQATSIGQYHGAFNSPYEGPFSLQSYPERDTSLTTTLFLGLRLDRNTQLYFDPEIAGGRGFSGVNGLANSSN